MHYNLGNVLRKLGQFDQAVASYSKALAIKPDHAKAHNNLGSVLQDLGKSDEAVISYNSALEINLVVPEAYINLGLAFRCFMGTETEMLVVGNAILLKEDQAPALKQTYEEAFDLD